MPETLIDLFAAVILRSHQYFRYMLYIANTLVFFPWLRSDHWVLIVLAPRDRKAYYLDSMKSKSKFKPKLISSLLNEALSEFSRRGGNLPSKGNTHNNMEKFKHITGISCVPHTSNLPAGYYLSWHLAHLVRIQEKLSSAEDIPKSVYKSYNLHLTP